MISDFEAGPIWYWSPLVGQWVTEEKMRELHPEDFKAIGSYKIVSVDRDSRTVTFSKAEEG